jgi:hypothetical protein
MGTAHGSGLDCRASASATPWSMCAPADIDTIGGKVKRTNLGVSLEEESAVLGHGDLEHLGDVLAAEPFRRRGKHHKVRFELDVVAKEHVVHAKGEVFSVHTHFRFVLLFIAQELDAILFLYLDETPPRSYRRSAFLRGLDIEVRRAFSEPWRS